MRTGQGEGQGERQGERQGAPRDPLPSLPHLRALMGRYRTANLVRESPEAFRAAIDRFLARKDGAVTGAFDLSVQRDLSQQFAWGHNHDFGDFALKGRMGDRHLHHLAIFIDVFGALPRDLAGRRVLDIGCWTGGTSLLLAAMGAEVVAIDEVPIYVELLAYLKQAFGVERLEVRHRSLYECHDFADAFDYVLFAGVLYHVTDPILALRITFNALKDGGVCLVETTGFAAPQPLLSYKRVGWNWFDMSPSALEQMLRDVGYAEARTGPVTPNHRLYAVARRARHVDMRRDGLSMPRVR